jgi:hypothetical protein
MLQLFSVFVVFSQTSVELRQMLLQQSNVLQVRCLKLAQIFLVNVSDSAGLDTLEKLPKPGSLFVPILRAHNGLRTLRQTRHGQRKAAVTPQPNASTVSLSPRRTSRHIRLGQLQR